MDDDIRLELKDVGKHIVDIGRQVASTKSNQNSIESMSRCLAMAKETLDTYLNIQKIRH